MIFCVEPGYYEDGSFGIRLENVLICKEANAKFNFGDKGYLAFEHITWVSISCVILTLPCQWHQTLTITLCLKIY
jgi:Xaa-Pro aminopeptidase